MFVDYAGQTVEVIDAATGEVRRAQVFVAALGASNLTYAEARWTQGLLDWNLPGWAATDLAAPAQSLAAGQGA